MLRFEVREVYLETQRRYFLPLPKLSDEQLGFLSHHLKDRGFSVKGGPRITARMGSNLISVDRIGLARSSEGALDALAPPVPELLRFSKQAVPSNPYFSVRKVRGGFAIRFTTRMESSSLWRALRASGQSGLTPDEALVAKEVLEGTEGRVECVTDYPTEGCYPLRVGRRAYYRSNLPVEEFVTNLRTTSSSTAGCAYLPVNGTLIVRARSLPKERLPEDLGEWCFLEPAPVR